MKPIKFLLTVFFVLGSLVAGFAQQLDNPITYQVRYWGTGVLNGGQTDGSFSIRFSPTGPVSTATCTNQSPGYQFTSTPTKDALKPGQNYIATVTGTNLATVIARFKALAGYDLYVDGRKTTGITAVSGPGTGGFNVTVRVEITPDETAINDVITTVANKRAGECSSFPEDKPIWYIGLGKTSNGRSAGALGFRSPTLTPALHTTSELNYDPTDTTEITVTRSSGYITQITAPEVRVEVDTYNASSSSYGIRIYQPGGSTPFITYTVQDLTVSGGTGLRIDKLEDGVTWTTVLQQVGSVWTLYDWRLNNDGYGTSNAVTTTVNGAAATVSYGGAVTKTKTYASVTWSDGGTTQELTSTQWGSAPATNFTYWNDSSTSSAAFRSVKSQKDPTGNWTAYTYYDETTPAQAEPGLLSIVSRPWLDSPAQPEADGSRSEWR